MNILVTGGAGFIGSHVVDELLKNHSVVVIDDLSTGSKKSLNPQAIFYQADICSSDLQKIFKKHKFDAIIHLAAQINARLSISDPLHDAKTNMEGTLNLLELAKTYKIPRFVFASSIAIYGTPIYMPCDENHPSNPLSPYGISKYGAEKYVQLYSRAHGIQYTILRYANVYGPRQNAKGEAGVISIFIDNALQSKPLKIFGDGKQTRDFVFVEDVAKATILGLSCRNITANIASDSVISITDLAKRIQRLSSKPIQIIYGDAMPVYIKHIQVDTTKAKKMLGWKASVPLDKGLEKTITYFRRYTK